MEIVLDTNVLISGTFWKGSSFKIIELCQERKLQLIITKETIKEYHEVLQYDEIQEKIAKKNLKILKTEEEIIEISKVVEPINKVNKSIDPDDNKFIEAAIEGKAKYIVSNDKHLLEIEKYKGIKIVKPEEFLKTIGTNKY